MRAIANGQLEGFPPKEVLRTVYVEHDIDASEAETPVVEFVFSDESLQDASHPSHGRVEEVLASVGFTPEMQAAPVASLSGEAVGASGGGTVVPWRAAGTRQQARN